MNKNTLIFIVLSIVFGIGAVFIARNIFAENKPQNVTMGQIAVFTVNTELPIGTLLDPKYIVATVIPENMLTSGTITDQAQLEGMLVKQKLFIGDIIRRERLVKKGEGSSLASLIGENMRAISIRVDDVVGVAGFLLPGNKVDVLSTYKTKGKNVTTDVILSNAKILAIDQSASNDENKPQIVRAVTLELNLAQAERLMNARNKGSIQLALRNPNDQTETGPLFALDQESIEIEPLGSSEEAAAEQISPISPISTTSEAPSNQHVVVNNALLPVAIKNPAKASNNRHKVEVIRGVKKESIQLKH